MLGRNSRLSLASLGLAVLLVLSGSQLASAATSTGAGNGLRVSPVRSDIDMDPGQTQTVTIDVTNVTTETATFQAIVNDFIANPNETGEPALLVNPNQYASSHSLKRYIAPISNVTIPA